MMSKKYTAFGYFTIVICIAGFGCETPKSLYLTENVLAAQVQSTKDNIQLFYRKALFSRKHEYLQNVYGHIINLYVIRKKKQRITTNFHFCLFGDNNTAHPLHFILQLHLRDKDVHIPALYHVTLDAEDVGKLGNSFEVFADASWTPLSNDSSSISIERPQQSWSTGFYPNHSVQEDILLSNTSLFLDTRHLSDTVNDFRVTLRLDLKAMFDLLRNSSNSTLINLPVLQVDGTEVRDSAQRVSLAERMTSLQRHLDDFSGHMMVFLQNFDNSSGNQFDWSMNEQWQEQPSGQNWWLILPQRSVGSVDRAVHVQLQASTLNEGQQHRLLIGVPHGVRVHIDTREVQAPFHVLVFCANGYAQTCTTWIHSQKSAALVTTELLLYRNTSSMRYNEGHIHVPNLYNLIVRLSTASIIRRRTTCIVIVEKFVNVVRLRLGAPATRSELVRWIRTEAFCMQHPLLLMSPLKTHLNNGLYFLSLSKKLAMLGNHHFHVTLSNTSNQSVLLAADNHLGIYFSGFFEFLHGRWQNRFTCPVEFRENNQQVQVQLRFWHGQQLQFVHTVSVEQCNSNAKISGSSSVASISSSSTFVALKASELAFHIDVMNDSDFGKQLHVYKTLTKVATLERYLMRVTPLHQIPHLGLMVFKCSWRCDFHSIKDEVTLLASSCSKDERLDVVAYVLRDSFYQITLPKAAIKCSRVLIRCATTHCVYSQSARFLLNGRELPQCLSPDNLCKLTQSNIDKTYYANLQHNDSPPLMMMDRVFLNYRMEDDAIDSAVNCELSPIIEPSIRLDMLATILIIGCAFFMGVIFMITIIYIYTKSADRSVAVSCVSATQQQALTHAIMN